MQGGHVIAADAVGVVAIGRDEGERLVRCLQSLASLRLPIVYVDSGSTDGSPDRARAVGAVVVDLDMRQPFTAARARNAGAAALLERHPGLTAIQFVDGDCSVAPGWIDAARAFLSQHPDVAIVCGRRREIHPDRSIYNAQCDEEWNTPVGPALACGGDALVRASAFAAVGGYDPRMVAHEEPEMCARLRALGGRIERIEADMTWHDADITRLSQWWRRNLRGGYGYAQAFARHPAPRSAEAGLLRRAAMWSGLLPLACAPALLGWWPSMVLLLAYPLQIVRLARRRQVAGKRHAWTIAALELLAKLPETLGALRHASDLLLRRRRGAILHRPPGAIVHRPR